MISGIVFLAAIVFIVVFSVLYMKAWNQGKAKRQAAAEAQSLRHGGQYVLEWDGSRAQGAGDGEFGALLVEIPKKSGRDSAKFYETGLVLGSKRVPYSNLKDVVFIPGSGKKGFTMKQRLRNSAVLWLYRKKGSTIGIRDLSYRFDNETMEKIRKGLGFC